MQSGVIHIQSLRDFSKGIPRITYSSDFNVNFGNSVNEADWLTTSNFLNPDGSVASTAVLKNEITGGNKGQQFTFQMDYTNPINDSTKVEMGVRSFANLRTQDYYFYTNINDKKELDRSISQNTDIDDIINAAYITYTSRLKGISYQAGVRFEQSKFDGNSKLDNTTSELYAIDANHSEYR